MTVVRREEATSKRVNKIPYSCDRRCSQGSL